MNAVPEITVAVCTRNRLEGIRKCLESLMAQNGNEPFALLVVENDVKQMARECVESFLPRAAEKGIEMRYFVEEEQNIAVARNRCVRECRTPFILFIDDDEYAAEDWVEKMAEIQRRVNADVVQGTCLPVFADGFPNVFKNCTMYGLEAFSEDCRKVPGVATNTTLYRVEALTSREEPLDRTYGTSGGSDFELSLYLDGIGKTQFKTGLAKVYEFQPLSRARLGFYLERDFREALNTYRAIQTHCGRMGAFRFLVQRMGQKIRGTFQSLRIFPVQPKRACLSLMEILVSSLGLLCAVLGLRKRGYR